MKRSLTFSSSLFLVTLFVPPVNARCYSVWKYPYPQRCNAGVAKLENAEGLKPSGTSLQVQVLSSAPDEDHSWYVEITKLPPDWERDLALEKLKGQLK